MELSSCSDDVLGVLGPNNHVLLRHSKQTVHVGMNMYTHLHPAFCLGPSAVPRMDGPSHILTGLGAVLTVLVALWLRPRSDAVVTLPGPLSPSWIYGNMEQLLIPENYGDHEFRWQKQYGSVYRVKGCFGEDRLVVSDPQALRHILNSPLFVRPPSVSNTAHLVFGADSVYCVEGEAHQRLRAAMGPGFSGKSVRSFLPVFVEVAKKMVHEWEITCSPGSSTRLNVAKMLDHATLDIIADAALGLPVNSVQNPEHPLAVSHLHVLPSAFIRSKSAFIAEFFASHVPVFMLRLALHLPIGPLAAVLSFNTVTKQLMEDKARDFEKNEDKPDLLSTILSGSAFSKTAITRSQLVHQLPIILLAGQDTSAAVLSWALYWLAQNPEFQQNLRQEILSNYNNLDSQEGYDNMPLLNALLKETLRMFPAGPSVDRCAAEDAVLPLSSEIVTSTGKHIRELPIRKGQFIFVAVAAYQRLEAVWGPDAHEFKPSRWLEGDPCSGQALGPYAQLLAFLGGHRVCAGWRFALLEMQVILTEVLATFSFSLPEDSIVRARLSATQFPVDSNGAKGLWFSVELVDSRTGN
ncbi:cytochrome P450 [Mycena vulgaris]|nr:cytochrome P450 [Mycena vulgaris]